MADLQVDIEKALFVVYYIFKFINTQNIFIGTYMFSVQSIKGQDF